MAVIAANDLITESLEEITAITAGDPLNATDAAKGLTVLNRLIDTGNIGRGNIYTERIDQYTLTIGKQTYTIGVDPSGVATADLAGLRPVRLTRCNLLLPSTGTTVVRRKINLLTKDQWSRKQVQNIAGMPVDLYNDGADPLSKYYIYQVPDQAYVIETYSWQQLAGCGPIIGTGTVTTVASTKTVAWVSGLQFTAAQAGAGIVINGVTYVVASYTNATTLVLATNPGDQATAVPYTTGGIATLIIVPPGYWEYWMYALAIRLAAPFGKVPSAATVAAWQEARANVFALNAKSPRMDCDGDLPSGADGLYNWLAGEMDYD